jgi:AcrR family transcriptional regulator
LPEIRLKKEAIFMENPMEFRPPKNHAANQAAIDPYNEFIMGRKQLTPTLNKHELRTKQTRELLLRAAETIFVRDGYEAAELGEIAAIAGRTKGAIYAHFKSKEEIFLALIEERALYYRTQMEKALGASESVQENMKLIRQNYLDMVDDTAWSLLFLEFKLYTIRHPESKERLEKHYEKFLPGNQEKRLVGFLGAVESSRNAISRSLAVQTLAPLLSALAVEASFAPDLLDISAQKKVAGRLFDALMSPSPR